MKYVARGPRFKIIDDAWTVEIELPCINGLNAWFVICNVEEASEEEIGYTEGAIGSAKERAEWIAKALNDTVK